LSFALGFLTKYNIAFLGLAFAMGLLLSPYRVWFTRTKFWLAILAALFIITPNLYWQYYYDFPVVTHMRILKATQLTHVSPGLFIFEQFLFSMVAVCLWLPGLYFLIFIKKEYRIFATIYIVVIALFLYFQGKGYYAMGIYPILVGAGGAFWSRMNPKKWLRWALPAFMVLMIWPIIPFGIPLLPPQQMIQFGKWSAKYMGLEILRRWEDDQIYDLPQDYADMFGWEELGGIITEAWEQAPDKARTLLYCENYGQAGAAMRFATPEGVIEPISFNGSFAIWAPVETDAHTLIYVNDELGEDIQEVFSDIKLVGTIENIYARERGTQVYLCQKPRGAFQDLWGKRIKEVKAELGIVIE
ncbi:MAG: glycosyltransferase family 39 protein, partial [Bacteroidota bacterium]